MTREELKKKLLDNPDLMLVKKPFTRGTEVMNSCTDSMVALNEKIQVSLPNIKKKTVSQAQFLEELDPNSHKVLFDDNVPSITMKVKNRYVTIEYEKMAIPFQKMIKNKHVLHLCGNPMQFVLMNTKPTEEQIDLFTTFKQYWELRNQDGMRTRFVDAQQSVGDAGLLYYFDYKGRIKSKVISFMDGYTLCPHNDANGDRLLECVYYEENGEELLDCYDDKYIYRYRKTNEVSPTSQKMVWIREQPEEHGFSEIPLVTKRGDVPWNDVQTDIEVYEVLYNVFMVIQKRHGWGILYVKGKFKDDGRKIAGAIVLNDTSIEGNGSAEFKTPPSPQGMIDTLDKMEETIQKGSGTTFILPKDVKMSGDISGIAIMLTQELDIEHALQNVIEWQNVADKMTRLFKEGLSKELVNKNIMENAVTRFQKIDVSGKFKLWRPQNDTDYNTMLMGLVGAGLVSKKTGINKNTESAPDEESRIEREMQVAEQKEIEKMKREASINKNDTINNTK